MSWRFLVLFRKILKPGKWYVFVGFCRHCAWWLAVLWFPQLIHSRIDSIVSARVFFQSFVKIIVVVVVGGGVGNCNAARTEAFIDDDNESRRPSDWLIQTLRSATVSGQVIVCLCVSGCVCLEGCKPPGNEATCLTDCRVLLLAAFA